MKVDEFKPNPDAGLVWRQVEAELVIVRPTDGQLVVLNGVGAYIWLSMDGNRTLSDLVDLVCGEYEVTRERALGDVLEFIRQLQSDGLLQDAA